MTTIPKGTTQEQWDQYYKELEIHETQMAISKPIEEDFKTESEYLRARQEWQFRFNVDAPNKPGYYRANND